MATTRDRTIFRGFDKRVSVHLEKGCTNSHSRRACKHGRRCCRCAASCGHEEKEEGKNGRPRVHSAKNDSVCVVGAAQGRLQPTYFLETKVRARVRLSRGHAHLALGSAAPHQASISTCSPVNPRPTLTMLFWRRHWFTKCTAFGQPTCRR